MTSQHGEHWLIDVASAGLEHGYACEVGAADGVIRSNTLGLEKRGWDVLCIEANPDYEKPLRRARKLVQMVACGKRSAKSRNFYVYEVEDLNFEALSALTTRHAKRLMPELKPKKIHKVPVRTLDECLAKARFPRLDVLSIDTEGTEGDVLDGFDIDRWKPRVMVIEDWVGQTHRTRLLSHGYALISRMEVNDFYIFLGKPRRKRG